MVEDRRKSDPLVWWLMITFAGILIIGGGAWATSINSKVERIEPMEMNIQYIQNDVSSIKEMIQTALKKESR